MGLHEIEVEGLLQRGQDRKRKLQLFFLKAKQAMLHTAAERRSIPSFLSVSRYL
jgi:hypothetical protein